MIGIQKLSLALATALVLASGLAAADPQSDKLFDEGRKLLETGDAKGACDKFAGAIAIDPTAAGTMLNLGLCNEKLGKYATALHWFRKAQTAAAEAKPRLPQHEQVAKDHTGALADKVATIAVAVAGGKELPANARIKLDHVDLKAEELSRVEVDPGHHVLDAGAPGMKNVHQEFDVPDKPGMGETRTLEFVEGSNAITIDRGAKRRKAAIYTAIGGGGLVLSSAIVGMYAAHAYCGDSFFTDWTKGGGSSCPNIAKVASQSDADSVNSKIKIARYGGTGLFIAGVATIGIASYFYFTAPQAEKIDQTVWVPTIDRDHVGFAVSGSF